MDTKPNLRTKAGRQDAARPAWQARMDTAGIAPGIVVADGAGYLIGRLQSWEPNPEHPTDSVSIVANVAPGRVSLQSFHDMPTLDLVVGVNRLVPLTEAPITVEEWDAEVTAGLPSYRGLDPELVREGDADRWLQDYLRA